MTSLPIATELDYGMVVAMAEQTEIFTGKDPVTAADVANDEATPINLRGATELQLQPSLENVDGLPANGIQHIQEDQHEVLVIPFHI